MNTSELEARRYAPCPTCGQYSHSIGEDQIVAAYNHFQAMVCENSAKPYPTGYAFSDETRDAANILLQSLSTLRQRIEALEAENGRLRDTFHYLCKWVERGLFDGQIAATEALNVIAYHPGMPWKKGRWDVDHKPYAEDFYRTFPNARQALGEG